MSNSITRQRRLRLGAALSLTILTIAGCAQPSSATRTRPKPASLNEIPKPEIEVAMTRYSNAFEMVRALRPNMLAARGLAAGPQSRSPIWEQNSGIKVYLDGFRYGGVESLAMISASNVIEIRWLSPMDATTRFGTGNMAGAIAVTSRAGPQ